MKHTISIIILSLCTLSGSSQNLTLNGYVKDMEGIYLFENSFPAPTGEEISKLHYNLVHNRLNFKAYVNSDIIVAIEMRNRVFSGKLINAIPQYADLIESDDGLLDLSWNLVEADNYFINSSVDRVYIDYMKGDFQVRLGRQRINWGINLVWNPNDIFNAFSYMDFDYEERPGSDALLVTYYPTFSSSLDIAYKAADVFSNTAFAAKYRFNFKNYDIQFIGGQAGNDWVLGGGWSGNIDRISFRGEASYFMPLADKKDISDEAFSGTISLDYSFENQLYLHASFLYNGSGTTEKGQSINLIDPNMQLSAKRLSVGKYELFGQVSYPIGTLLNTGVATMLNPVDMSMFVAPSFSVSLHNNLELYLTTQILLGEPGTEYGSMGNLFALFGRVRWSF